MIILTGADPAFCAGLDLDELASEGGRRLIDGPGVAGPAQPRAASAAEQAADRGDQRCAVTGGLELALNCDFLVASERAKFGDTHARLGMMPGWGLSALLPQAIGVRRAREMSFTGNFVDAAEALALGLVNHVVPHDELIPFTRPGRRHRRQRPAAVRQGAHDVRGDHPRRRRLGDRGTGQPGMATHQVQRRTDRRPPRRRDRARPSAVKVVGVPGRDETDGVPPAAPSRATPSSRAPAAPARWPAVRRTERWFTSRRVSGVLLALLVLGAAFVAINLHRRGHTTGDDWALYVRMAKSLFEGNVADVISDNRSCSTTARR